jgi:emp24/gp25L/p24 family/GOLD
VESELRRIEEVVGEIVTEMDYLRQREVKLRDTNESTNERVKWFAIASMCVLISLGGWQVIYLRAYFRWVPLHSANFFTNLAQVEASHLNIHCFLYYTLCVKWNDGMWRRRSGYSSGWRLELVLETLHLAIASKCHLRIKHNQYLGFTGTSCF